MKQPVSIAVLVVMAVVFALCLTSGLTSATPVASSYWQISTLPSPTFTPGGPPAGTSTPTPGTGTGCQELLLNGGFETNDPNSWFFPATAWPGGYSTAIAHSGQRSLRTGVVTTPDHYSYSDGDQYATIPAGTQSTVLSFWWYPISAEPPLTAAEKTPSMQTVQALADHNLPQAALSGDVQYALILNSAGTTVATLVWTRSNAQTWQQRSFTLSPSLTGQRIRVVFGVFNNGDGRRTAMYIDDASLSACSNVPPGTTATPTGTAVAGATPTATGTVVSPTGAQLYLSPSTSIATSNQTFTVSIVANTGIALADTVDAYLNFDPFALEVVDTAGNPASFIDLNTTVFPGGATINSVDNNAGQINLSASQYNSPYLSGTFTVATIRFRAKGSNGTTQVSFVRSGVRKSDLLKSGASLQPSITDGTVSIIGGIALNGRVALQGLGAPGDLRWRTQLFRTEAGVTTAGVIVYQPVTGMALAGFTASTDAFGAFSIPLNGVAPGTYDIVVKGSNTLANERFAVSLPSPAEVTFGTLFLGDTNGDDVVNGGDVSYMVPSFLKTSADAAFRPYADVNKDGVVNGADVSTLVPNFLVAGPMPVAGLAANQKSVAAGPDAATVTGASLSLSPVSRSANPGSIVTVDIVFDTGTGSADTVDAYLNFDPSYLQVVNAQGNPATSIEWNPAVLPGATYNVVNNTTGQINFSATKFQSPYLTGSQRAATIRFRTKTGVPSTAISFVRSGARQSDLLSGGKTINPTLLNGTMTIAQLPVRGYMPAMLGR